MWERWDGMLPDGSINPGEMTSFNHYALGSVASWLHSVVGGLSPHATPMPAAIATGPETGNEELVLDENAVGWRKVRIRPQPGGDLTWCKTAYDGTSGLVECSWQLVSDVVGNDSDSGSGSGRSRTRFMMDVIIPPNTTAVVKLPDANMPDDSPGFEVGSGAYHFECWFRDPGRWPPKAIKSFDWQKYLD
ncbi:Six-hairpin glycosidase [Apiospora phragmitis]|uniref:Six-hairpin glycosidase n=1 Tax=Apiospora phragmitis TaxID=2905665 RepID=A0ABR1VD22_9PEZI